MTEVLSHGALQVITDYAYALNVLDCYDHGTLRIEQTSGAADFVLGYETVNHFVQSMKRDFDGLFGIEKDQGFKSALGTISQTFDGKELVDGLWTTGKNQRCVTHLQVILLDVQ